jgi:hypothetical protein
MMKRFLFVSLAACTASLEPPPPPVHVEVIAADRAGVPAFVRGVIADTAHDDALPALRTALGLADTDLALVETRSDELGGQHLHYQPSIDASRSSAVT